MSDLCKLRVEDLLLLRGRLLQLFIELRLQSLLLAPLRLLCDDRLLQRRVTRSTNVHMSPRVAAAVGGTMARIDCSAWLTDEEEGRRGDNE
jgi:hypothetical protein